MRLIDVLRICILGAFMATILTGIVFIMQSSDENVYTSRKIHKPIDEPSPKSQPHIQLNKKPIVSTGESIDLKAREPEPVRDLDFVDLPKEFMVLRMPPPVANDQSVSGSPPSSTTKVPPTTTTTTTTTTKAETTTTAAAATMKPTIAPKMLKELKDTSRTPSVHIFYYPWYGSPQFNDGQYVHWNHFRLKPDGTRSTDPKDQYHPPNHIAAVQYPQLGPYSSADPAVIKRHMKWLSSAGVDVVSVSWFPKNRSDPSGVPTDSLMPALLNMTEKYKMKLNFHLEPYAGRTVDSIRADIQYILDQYGRHPAFYRTTAKAADRQLPLFYVYDSYTFPADEWLRMLAANGSATIRNTPLDALMIALYVKAGEEVMLKQAGFDGLYTYFAAEGFSHGSTISNWPMLSAFCVKENLLFIPSVGPGYNDTAVRPWNARNARSRENGDYYREHFKMAHMAKADIVSITSFNEWHEGTQIEPAVGMPAATNSTSVVYESYEKGPEEYLQITLEMVKAYFTPRHENIPMQIARVV